MKMGDQIVVFRCDNPSLHIPDCCDMTDLKSCIVASLEETYSRFVCKNISRGQKAAGVMLLKAMTPTEGWILAKGDGVSVFHMNRSLVCKCFFSRSLLRSRKVRFIQ